MKRRILLVEDDMLMREFITDYFKKEQWEVYEAENGRLALEIFEQNSIDLIVLDIMMPEMDGWSVCRRIREKSDVPIIMITARAEDDDQLMGFELGADEYVTKPFSPRVLVARATALMKRTEGTIGREGDTAYLWGFNGEQNGSYGFRGGKYDFSVAEGIRFAPLSHQALW